MKGKMKKLLAVLLTCGMMAALLAGCGSGTSSTSDESSGSSGGSSQEAEQSENDSEETSTDGVTKINVAVTKDITTLNPLKITGGVRAFVNYEIYEKLAYILDSELYMVMMKDYEKVNDNTYEVTIYDYIYDTLGNHITADDVIWCFEQSIANGEHTRIGIFSDIYKVDDYTIAFEMESSDEVVGSLWAAWDDVWIVSQASYEASSDQMSTDVYGTGPYKLKEYVASQYLVLEKNEDYWQTDESLWTPYSYANVDEIQYTYFGEAAQITIALQTGDVDMSQSVPTTELVYFEEGGENSDDYYLVTKVSDKGTSLLFNCDVSVPTGNENLRKAIAYAVDADGVLASTYTTKYGQRISAPASPLFSDYQSAWDDEPYFEYDLDTAKEYLAAFEEETGISASDLNLTILCMSANSTDAEIISGYLDALGIKTSLDVTDYSGFNEKNKDSSAWDLIVNPLAGGVYFCDQFWAENAEELQSHEGTDTFLVDDTFQELLYVACHESGHTEDDVNALRDYMNEICYKYGLYASYSVNVVPNTVTELVLNTWNYPVPGASTYVWNE
ncbi:MAG: ABC transporter substrate-binding protein [Lachnospiraceae bacterium]|nr:ABC transporter substrate-binding protein [Lachnospiraceae bacterium]